MGARSAFVAAARRHAIDGNWRGCARSLLRWRSAIRRGEAARARPCDGRVVGAAVARGCLPRLPDAAATQRIAEYLGEGRAALLDRARGAEAETHALAARCAHVAAALEGGDDGARRAGAELAQRAGDQVATKTLAKARARLLLALGDAEAAAACHASMDLLQFADQITIRPLASKLLAVKASQRRGEDVVTSILRACRRLARVARPGDAGVADFAMDIAETHLERLNHLGAGALLEVLFASDRRRDAAFVLNRLRTEEAWPRPTAEIFSIVVRDLILRGEPAEVVEDVLVHMANDAIAPTPRVLDACLAAPHAVQLSLIQRLHALSGARPSYDLFVERCVSTNLAEENYDEARRAAYVLEQMWPDADVSSVFEEYGEEFY